MPRDLPTGLVTLLKSGFAETHSTLAISLLGQGRSIKQTIYLATAAEGGSGGVGLGQTPASAIAIANAGFETPFIGGGSYLYNPGGAGWTFTGNSGMAGNGSPFANTAPEGVQVGFVQTNSGVISQVLAGFVGGTDYLVKFRTANRPGNVQTFDVFLDTTLVGTVTPTSGSSFDSISLPFTAGQTTYTLKFVGKSPSDNTATIDDVQIVPASGGVGRPPNTRPATYQPRLRQTGPVAMSLTRSADRCDIVIENIDRLAGHDYVTVQDALYGSFAEFGRIWRDLRNPQNVYQVTLLTGQIVAARASEMEVQLTIMSDVYASGAIAGQILYGRSCPWTFKDPQTCAFVGPEATCNKLLDDPGGCSGRSNKHHFGGFPYIKSVDTISDAAGIQANLQYQTIIQPAAASREELEAGARSTTAIIQRHNLLLQGFTITDSPADDATKIVAGGVGGANYQTLKENDGYSYARILPPQPTLNFLNAFKLKDDPGNLETDISTYGVPTGMLNVRTDFNASGSGAVTNLVSFNIGGVVTVQTTLNLQPGMGILVQGAGLGGADFRGTVGSVSTDGKTYVLTEALINPPTLGSYVQADDTDAVQAWITAHGDLAFPPGYYRISAPIIVPTTSEGYSVVVHGAGWDLSVFAFQHGGDGFVPTLPDLKVDSLVFKDLTIATGTKWNDTGLVDAANHGYGIRMTAPGYLGVYNNFVLERCRIIGWGCFGIISDNMEVSWVNNCIFRENRFGHVAFVAPDQLETAKLPNANVLRSNAFDQAFGGGDAHRTASGSMTQPPVSPTPAQTDAARAISFGGVSLTAADRGRIVIVHGAGTNNSNLYSFIDVVLTGTTAKLAHAAQTTVSGQTVEIFSSSIASIFLNRAHDTIIDGGTIQGNFTLALPSEECNAIRADECFNLRIVGVHEEDAGGNGGAAIRLANCIAVKIENYGGTSAGPGLTNAHNADFQLINTHGVSVKNCFFNDRPQFVVDDTSSEHQIDDSWVVGYNNLWQADRSWDRLRIGSGVRTAQAAESRTAQTAGNEYSYDGFFGRDLVLNGQFLDGSDGFESWTKATGYISRTSNSPFQGGTFINVNATGVADAGGTPVLVLEQLVVIPDDVGPGLFTLGFNWNLDFQGGTEQTGRFMEVRLHPSSGVDEAIQWSTRPFPVVQDVWQVGHVRCFLGTGTGRTIAIRINVTQGPNNVSMHFANFRLAAGKHIFGSWERGISDFGGRMRAPLEFAPITNPPYPPPPTGSPYLSIVNIAGVLNQGKNGAYTPIGTTGGPGTILGPPNYFSLFKPPTGDALDYGALKQETTAPFAVHVTNAPLLLDRTRPLMSTYGDLGAGPGASLVLLDSTNVVYFGPEFNAASTQTGSDVVIRAAHGNVSSLQISGSGRRMTFNRELALSDVTPPLPTFLLEISDLALDGLRIQPRPNPPELYLGYMLSCFLNGGATDALFAVNQNGDIVRIKNRSYLWPDNHAPGVLTNNGTGSLSWGGGGGHAIWDEGVALATQRATLNFKGPGVQAYDEPVTTRTTVEVFTADSITAKEGTVSLTAQHFAGRKHFHNGLTAYDGVSVPIVAQYTGSTSNATIQEWWISGSTPLAYIDTQPVLRLGYPGAGVGRAGYLELCNDGTVETVKFACGIAATQSQILYFPTARPATNQFLQVLSVFGSDIQLKWGTAAATGTPGHEIQDEGGPLTYRGALNFTGSGIVAVDSTSGFARTDVFVVAATPSVEGTVSIGVQHFGGRKHFDNGLTAYDSASVPLVAQYTGGTPNASIQEWWITGTASPIALLNTQPTLRLGIPAGRAGFVELSNDTGAGTVKLGGGQGQATSYTLTFPAATPVVGSTLQVLNAGGQLVWSAAGTAGHVIYEEGTPLAQRAGLKFQGSAFTATDDGTYSVITTNPATATLDGVVSSIAQTFGGRKTFNAGAVMQGLASTVPVLTVQLSSDATSTARLQEWRDPAGSVLGYYSATALHLGAQGFLDGMLELASASSVNFSSIRSATFPAASLIYVLPIATPTPGQVLGVDTIVGSVINTKWISSATGSGNVTVTAPQGTDKRVSRWSGTSPTTALVDSAIEDRTTSGTGTVEMDASIFLLRNAGGAAEVVDFFMRTPGSFSTIWRYDRRTGFFPPNGIADALNTDELQLHFGNFNSTPTILGTHHSWFQGGLRVRPSGGGSGNSGTIGNAFEVQDTTGVVKFAVAQNGNLAYIFGFPYVWPNAAPVLNAVLKCTDAATGTLSWVVPSTGSGNVSSVAPQTAGTLPKWGGAANTITDSGISDDGSQIGALGNQFNLQSRANDWSDVLWFTAGASPNKALWRYQHSSGNLADGTANAAGGKGEMQLFLQTEGVPRFFVGSEHSWIQSALRVRPFAGYSADAYTFEAWAPGAGTANFRIKTDGDLSMIKSQSYVWPSNQGQTGSSAYVLANDGVGNLTWRTFPTGTGSGANVQLSNLDASGTNITPSTSINTHLGFSVDGGWNIGAPAHRVGSMYLLGTFFMYPTGSTNPSSPKAFGFLDPAGGEYTKVLLSGNAHIVQGGNGQRLQFTSYHSFEFRGNRRNTGLGTPLAFFAPSGNDSSSALFYLDRNNGAPDCIPLLVNTDQAITSDLFRCQMQAIDRFRVGPQGSIISAGGTRHRAIELQYPANSFITIQTDWRTIIVDTVNGPQNLTLPSAQANPGMIIDIIHMKAVQQILSPLSLPGTFVPGYDAVVNVKTSGSDAFNAWGLTGNPQATNFKLGYPGTNGLPAQDNQHKMIKLIADEYLAIWWLMPYYL